MWIFFFYLFFYIYTCDESSWIFLIDVDDYKLFVEHKNPFLNNREHYVAKWEQWQEHKIGRKLKTMPLL